LILCVNETGGVRACVADPFVRAKVMKGCDTFTVPLKRAQAAGRIYREKRWLRNVSVSIAWAVTTHRRRQ
jgi:hypothetical protein